MKPSTTIGEMLAPNRIFVPTYQRAYSWDTETDGNRSPKQVNTFLADLEEYMRSSSGSPYYFGHFLFEEKGKQHYGVIDGQQRLTTIIIFLSAIFSKLESIRSLNSEEEVAKEDLIIRRGMHRFETVDYDKQVFIDYVIEQTKKDKKGLETASAKRIVSAFDFFSTKLEDKDEHYLTTMLKTVRDASCSTHPVKNESEAIQMFIFQNNRGKKPSVLEIIKAQFMFNVHLHAGDEKDLLIEEIKFRFEKIYKSISSIEYKLDEDEVLVYTLRVHFNSLWEYNATEKIDTKLAEGNSVLFIKNFTNSLASSFELLTTFFGKDEREQFDVHSLIALGGIGVVIPFIIKAYKFGLETDAINKLCRTLESLVLRHRLIGTRAEINSRLNDVYQGFTSDNPSIDNIISRIEMLRKRPDSWWHAYWSDEAFENSIQSSIPHATAKYLLWRYENHLRSGGKQGYLPSRFESIVNPELEHIAPQTPTDGKPVAAGYCEYDEEFQQQYLNCLGNYLLVSKFHNRSIGNKPFVEKRDSYTLLDQQREIQDMTRETLTWTKFEIKTRKEKIIKFILDTF